MKKYFITGISTEVGKTVASAIFTEALKADYWKPIQAGELEDSDSHKIKKFISNKKTIIHPNSYALKTPMSPHAAAEIENITIDLAKIIEPKTDNENLVIEGAGGLFVPLNNTDTILDIIKPDYKVIVVSRHYLGSINHSLLTVNLLKEKGFDVSIIFSGDEHKTTEQIIKKMTNVPIIGRIDEEPYFDKSVIKEYADIFRDNLINL
ncbi:dethiobiotin synthase [Tenacibaculum finnmarkense]|uniref:ATP-dependent dethiobiotin synthetase BioD n=1 Tax=Tenacibaculum finnmarkense genomovar ulcerans TaxID=2781388 RepID=A0A2I2M9V7_9FLAO|nr:dethiobiotin synthase [Tenacibaculum finnmarkense]ALU73988.1 ATP-dependent dethiobiotin synthetase BioD [Tenacibaculum dicentrarchi]MBE7634146.1 dethiobiotin synthase [Tenacibaculum finnmarkense genomovar ulcerans]MBE7697919.1 dethiobiotin synthase [Tenacibaculum finnmarkense genomovar ulcerans]MCD8430094.1 dethiobiotin synthase [Tenacibaculum finnmarkense genomovar ulcerans]SOU89333.1 ATP-dependent dethiobiotin synthetase BioD [Tenacibaculum finnmarkense genomovar ulcerans]